HRPRPNLKIGAHPGADTQESAITNFNSATEERTWRNMDERTHIAVVIDRSGSVDDRVGPNLCTRLYDSPGEHDCSRTDGDVIMHHCRGVYRNRPVQVKPVCDSLPEVVI